MMYTQSTTAWPPNGYRMGTTDSLYDEREDWITDDLYDEREDEHLPWPYRDTPEEEAEQDAWYKGR